MQIKHFPVRHPLLKDYIDYYYLLTTVDAKSAANYMAYPSVNTPLCFLDRCTINITPQGTIVRKDNLQGLKSVIVGRSIQPVRISLQNGIQEFCVIFKPLGINVITKKSLGNLLYPGLKETDEFDFLKGAVAKILLDDQAIDELESLILERIHCTPELEKLHKILRLISENELISFKQAVLQVDIPYKTIYRLFHKHLGLSPILFRRIVKFRAAMKKGVDPSYKTKMSMIALESGYFDQAHYINEFKKIAKLTPKNFDLAVWLDESKRIAWKLE